MVRHWYSVLKLLIEMLWEMWLLWKMRLGVSYLKRGRGRTLQAFNRISSTSRVPAEHHLKHPTRHTPYALGTLCRRSQVHPFRVMTAL